LLILLFSESTIKPRPTMIFRRFLLAVPFILSLPFGASAQCNAAFNTIVTPGFTAVQFFDASTGANLWSWDFGDGSTSNQQNPVHNYAATGTYSVCLVVFGLTGCIDSLCQQVVVPAPGACTASFTVQSVAPGFPGLLFTGTGTGVAPFTYTWDFGDGNVVPASPLNTVNYIYTVPGTYNVCLTITDANNCTATSCQTVNTGTTSCPPTFLANVLPTTGTVLFQDATLSSDPVVSWSWNFGDGTSLSGTGTATHTYQQSGNYNVCLSIVTQSGCTGSACSTVVVTVPAACSASFTTSQSTAPLEIAFTPTIVPSTATHIWDFGDGSLPLISNAPLVQQHQYSAAGSYLVCLTVQDGLCTDTFCTNVAVAPVSGLNAPTAFVDAWVFPNPAGTSCSVVLQSGFTGLGSVVLYDLTGNAVQEIPARFTSSGTNRVDLDLQGVAAGLYRLSVSDGSHFASGRLAVLK
jgi:PKD repeat protein